MANIRYFADLPNGETITLKHVNYNGGRSTKASSFYGYVEGLGQVTATRMIEMKPLPRRHNCDDRCMYAQGKTMKCECACGGINHGKGRVQITCEAA